jgi:DNA-binding NarL/FixJ family response regulator
MGRTRILIADNYAFALGQWCALLEPEFEVIGTVADGLSLVEAARRLSPNVVLTDITMPALDGLSAAERILRVAPETRVIFVSVHADPVLVQRSLETGASGYVLKVAAGEDLIPAVRSALRGERFVSALPTAGAGHPAGD